MTFEREGVLFAISWLFFWVSLELPWSCLLERSGLVS